jgi:hypothetical protein
MQVSKLIAVTIVTVAIVIVASANANNSVQSPEIRTLETRVQMLEQRLYSIEASVNRLQLPSRTSPTTDSEILLMRQELQNLYVRLADAECGLVKLDQRTTQARPNTTKPTDPCRLNSAQPIELRTRP